MYLHPPASTSKTAISCSSVLDKIIPRRSAPSRGGLLFSHGIMPSRISPMASIGKLSLKQASVALGMRRRLGDDIVCMVRRVL